MYSSTEDGIQIIKRNKIIELLYELIRVKIDSLRSERDCNEKEKIENKILTYIDNISDV